jgi:predicted membrane chloride channel (bestrophin family)
LIGPLTVEPWLLVTMVLQHLGPLHTWETVLTYVLAIAPFVVLGIVIWIRQRHNAADEPTRHSSAR